MCFWTDYNNDDDDDNKCNNNEKLENVSVSVAIVFSFATATGETKQSSSKCVQLHSQIITTSFLFALSSRLAKLDLAFAIV